MRFCVVMASTVILVLAGCDARPAPVDAATPDAGTVDVNAADAATPADGAGLPICPSPSPVMGAPCATGDACMIPGTPCYFVYRCESATWAPHTICPAADAGR